jgi:hypothetical protein
MDKNEQVATGEHERRHAEPANKAHVAKCFEIISKIVALKAELRGMERTAADHHEVAAMCRADKELMGKLYRAEAEYMFPFPCDWRTRKRFRGWPGPMPNERAEVSGDELEWQRQLDGAIRDLVETFAPEGIAMVAALGSDNWIAELREHIEHVYGVFGEGDEETELIALLDCAERGGEVRTVGGDETEEA